MFTITNLKNETLYLVPDIALAKGKSQTVDVVTEVLAAAEAAGDISITGTGYMSAADKTAITLTDNTGVATPGNTIADVGTAFSQTTLNDNFAALATTVNSLVGTVDALQTALGVVASQVAAQNQKYTSVAQAGG